MVRFIIATVVTVILVVAVIGWIVIDALKNDRWFGSLREETLSRKKAVVGEEEMVNEE